MCNQGLYLRNIEEADLALMDAWLHKPYILHWYEDPEAWIDEIKQRSGDFAFIHHFIVMEDEQPIGFCQYYDCYNAGEEWYSVHTPGETYSVDYLIGEEQYLRKGYGKKIIQMLIDRIREETQAKEIIVQPEEENQPSCKALISCGFEYDKTTAYYKMNLQREATSMNWAHRIDKTFSGVISIAKDGKDIFRGGFGFADKANQIPNENETKFGTASAGKVFVATAILGLIEKGVIQFESSIGDLLDFDMKQIDPQITIRQLLNHTSGIPDYFDETVMHEYEDLWKDFPNYRIRKSADIIPLFIDKPMMYPRGQRFQYNNTGYVVLGLVIEAVVKMPFDDYLQKAIFEPCGMVNTGYYELDRLPARCAFSYIYDDEKNDYRTNIFSIDAKGTGAGGAFTTAPDIQKFWDALLGEKLINASMLKQMLSPQVDEQCYGYGVWLLDGKIPSFQGCDPGANFFTSYDVDKNLSITILSNIDYDVESLHDELYSLASSIS